MTIENNIFEKGIVVKGDVLKSDLNAVYNIIKKSNP